MKYLFLFSVLLNIFFIVYTFKPFFAASNSFEGIAENRTIPDCSEVTLQKDEIKYQKVLQKKETDIKLSRVYLLPHPPDFLEGKYINIQKFEKINIEGKIFWKLEEVTDNGKVKSWEVEESSVRWK